MHQLESNPRPVRSWGLFFAFGLLIAAHGLYMIVLPTADPGHWRSYTSDADVMAYLADEFRASRRNGDSPRDTDHVHRGALVPCG